MYLHNDILSHMALVYVLTFRLSTTAFFTALPLLAVHCFLLFTFGPLLLALYFWTTAPPPHHGDDQGVVSSSSSSSALCESALQQQTRISIVLSFLVLCAAPWCTLDAAMASTAPIAAIAAKANNKQRRCEWNEGLLLSQVALLVNLLLESFNPLRWNLNRNVPAGHLCLSRKRFLEVSGGKCCAPEFKFVATVSPLCAQGFDRQQFLKGHYLFDVDKVHGLQPSREDPFSVEKTLINVLDRAGVDPRDYSPYEDVPFASAAIAIKKAVLGRDFKFVSNKKTCKCRFCRLTQRGPHPEVGHARAAGSANDCASCCSFNVPPLACTGPVDGVVSVTVGLCLLPECEKQPVTFKARLTHDKWPSHGKGFFCVNVDALLSRAFASDPAAFSAMMKRENFVQRYGEYLERNTRPYPLTFFDRYDVCGDGAQHHEEVGGGDSKRLRR